MISLSLHFIVIISCLNFNRVKSVSNNEVLEKISYVDLIPASEVSALPEIDRQQEMLAIKSTTIKAEKTEQVLEQSKIENTSKTSNSKEEVSELVMKSDPKPSKAKTAKNTESTNTNNSAIHSDFEAIGVGYNGASKIGSLSANYESILISKLEKAKRYPSRALARHLEGEVILALKIKASGEVLTSEIKQTSGFSFFDEEVLKMVERAAPFPALPNKNASDNLSYVIPVTFRLS